MESAFALHAEIDPAILGIEVLSPFTFVAMAGVCRPVCDHDMQAIGNMNDFGESAVTPFVLSGHPKTHALVRRIRLLAGRIEAGYIGAASGANQVADLIGISRPVERRSKEPDNFQTKGSREQGVFKRQPGK